MINIAQVNILGVSSVYPTRYRPSFGSFVPALFQAMRDLGAGVHPLAPLHILRHLAGMARQRSLAWNHGDEEVARPAYWTFLPSLFLQPTMRSRLTARSIKRAVERAFPLDPHRFDFAYAHFFTTGLACLDICERHNLKCVVALGESNLAYSEHVFGKELFSAYLQRFAGIITVSKGNEQFCRERQPALAERLIYIPNAVDMRVFRPLERMQARQQLGIPLDLPIAVFSGHFEERKGPLRVLDAVAKFPEMGVIFLGQGRQIPCNSQVLHAGPVSHAKMPLWLSAADFFVLPSLAEGMSNAVLEAMACGLPLIVSNRSFNREFLTDECAVFIEPNSVDSIAQAIHFLLKDIDQRSKMSKAVSSHVKNFDLLARARRIIEFGLRI